MKYLITLILVASFVSIVYGFSILEEQMTFAHKCIGFGTVGIFLVAMPLFLLSISKGKKLKDYMLNEENILKMREQNTKKSDNQQGKS